MKSIHTSSGLSEQSNPKPKNSHPLVEGITKRLLEKYKPNEVFLSTKNLSNRQTQNKAA